MASEKTDSAREKRAAAAKFHVNVVAGGPEDLSVGDEDSTPEELTEEFGDAESADTAKSQAEKADPYDEKNQP
jgi:hypothetical protein